MSEFLNIFNTINNHENGLIFFYVLCQKVRLNLSLKNWMDL